MQELNISRFLFVGSRTKILFRVKTGNLIMRLIAQFAPECPKSGGKTICVYL